MGTPEQWAALYTDDAMFSLSGSEIVGSEALKGFAAATLNSGMGMHHLVVNEVIDVNGDEATGIASVVVFMAGSLTGIGRYKDTLRRVNGRWRFASRHFEADAGPSPTP